MELNKDDFFATIEYHATNQVLTLMVLFRYKPYILGYLHLWKHQYWWWGLGPMFCWSWILQRGCARCCHSKECPKIRWLNLDVHLSLFREVLFWSTVIKSRQWKWCYPADTGHCGRPNQDKSPTIEVESIINPSWPIMTHHYITIYNHH